MAPDEGGVVDVLIIGGGQAGLEAAAALRAQGFAGSVAIVCEEAELPYQRPPLSKDYLHGKMEADSLPLRALSYYDAHNISVVLDKKVFAIDRAAKRVQLESGMTLAYAKLILATGARNRLLTVEGAAGRVQYLRSQWEAKVLRDALPAVQNVVVIGGGFIGLEVAAAARAHGKNVTVLEAAPRLMARAVPPIISDFFLALHQQQGVEVQLNARIIAIEDDAVVLGSQRLPADLVVAGIGVKPNQELAAEAGLATANGIVVDEYLRTSDPDIYAIGDCAEHPNKFANALMGGRVRLESVQNAVDQAKCVARGIISESNKTPYAEVPWFWTDQFGVRFQMAGLSEGYGTQVVRGSIVDRKFSVFYFAGDENKLIAVDSVGRFGDHIAARKILASGAPLTPEQAADETFDLKKAV